MGLCHLVWPLGSKDCEVWIMKLPLLLHRLLWIQHGKHRWVSVLQAQQQERHSALLGFRPMSVCGSGMSILDGIMRCTTTLPVHVLPVLYVLKANPACSSKATQGSQI